MDNDCQTTTGRKEQPEEERQNRRQFFNGLGKWSLAIIAAVTALRGGVQGLQSAIGSRFETGSGGAGEPRQQIAKKKHRTGINRILTNRTTIMLTIIETIIVLNNNRAEDPSDQVDRRH